MFKKFNFLYYAAGKLLVNYFKSNVINKTSFDLKRNQSASTV